MTKSRVYVSVMAIMVLVLLVAASGNAGEVLRFKFVPQQEIAYDVWVTGVGSISFAGLPIPIEGEGMPGKFQGQFNANASLSLYVKSVDEEGNATVGLRLGTLRLQGQAMGESGHIVLDLLEFTVEVNGQKQQIPKEATEQLAGLFQQLTATISPRGKVLDISGLPELPTSDEIGLSMPWGNAAGLKEFLDSIPVPFPEGAVAVGDSWDLRMSLPLPGVVTGELPQFALHYTLKKIGEIEGHRVANIAFDGSVEAADLAFEVPGGVGESDAPVQMKIAFAESIAGNIYFDLDTGQVHSERGNLTMNVNFEVPLPEEAGQFFPTAPSMQLGLQLHFVVSPG